MTTRRTRPQKSRSTRPLLPEPRTCRSKPGFLTLPDDSPVVLTPDSDERDLLAARLLCDRWAARSGRALVIETHAERRGLGPCIELVRGDASGIEGDAYRIDVTSKGVRVRAGGGAGLRWAAETLAQWVDERGRLPLGRIDDAPDFERRGIMLDISRGKVPTLESLCELVDLCAALKLNVLMLYVEHTFRFRRHPRIGEFDSPLLAEEMRTLDAYAAANHVELVPSLQSLGHMEHVLKLPEYAALAESEAGWTLAPERRGTQKLLSDLYSEYLPNFRSPLFNANCDEPWDLGRGRSAKRERARGPGGVFVDHVNRLQQLAHRHGKRTMIWADVVHAHPERIPELHDDLVFLDWWYEADFDYDRAAVFAEHRRSFMVCPGTSSWNCLFPRIGNSVRNISGWADAGRRHGAEGLLNTDWGDFGHYNLQGLSFFGYAWGAQQAWSGDRDASDFDRAFSRLRFDDRRGEIARLYRALGDVHDLGFELFNGSSLQAVFFDTLEEGVFIDHCRAKKVRAALTRLERIIVRIEAAQQAGFDDPLTLEEISWAAHASIFSALKAEAGLEHLAWRRAPESLAPRARRALARRLVELADHQAVLAEELERLWLARSHRSNLDDTLGRIERSMRSMRTAAKSLERNRPAKPPAREPLTPARVLSAFREGLS